MTLAILCSGQGGQTAAMFDLTAACVPAQPVFEAAAAITGSDPRVWVRGATEAELHANRAAQLLCCTQALAAWAALDLQRTLPGEDIVLAGYSVGELASWGCAGLIAPAALLQLAVARACAMDAAAGADTTLAAVRGLHRPALESLCRLHGCELAIVLSEDGFIVGGRRDALIALTQRALAGGAHRSGLLPIGVASHTSLLRAASAEFRQRLDDAGTTTRRITPGLRLLSGLDGDVVREIPAGLDRLARQISHTLDWAACLTACREAGATRVLELGPGRALAMMARDALPQARCHALEEFRTVAGVLSWLQASRAVG